ncbi:MAG: phenylalanine--tRNA ligase beta subunit-related protein [Bacilli bacterium]|nr:phenylalanine--tRNA ligase beta subunit-related protein [Bacilli bacterium]
MIIKITKSISDVLLDFDVIAFKMAISVNDSSHLEALINYYEELIEKSYTLEEVLEIKEIKAARNSYKALGKDPSRYRLACESLLRRLVKKNKLYRISDVVDLGNLLSIELKRSTALLDFDKIKGDVYIRRGLESDIYEGIGRGIINVSNIPLYCDSEGAFGSPTSDTLRTAITADTKKLLLMIICFDKCDKEEIILKTKEMFKKHINVSSIETVEVIKESI